MRRGPETIVLGERCFEVRPLTVAQVQAIEPLVVGDPQVPGANIAAAVAILRVALDRDHAEAAGELDTIEADAPMIGAAMAQVLRLGGFLPDGERSPSPGEAEAGRVSVAPVPASTGPSSTQG